MPAFREKISTILQQLRPRWVALTLGIYWVGLFVGTHIPLPKGILVGGSDKVIHIGAYAGLGFLLGLWILRLQVQFSRRRVLITAFGILFGWAIVDELLQIPVNRTADVYDCLADWAGAAFGLLVLWALLGRSEEASGSRALPSGS